MHFIDTVNTKQAKFRTKKRYVRAYSFSCVFAKWLRSITRLSHLSVLHSVFFVTIATTVILIMQLVTW